MFRGFFISGQYIVKGYWKAALFAAKLFTAGQLEVTVSF
jgi:hypothetical protein